MADKENGLCWTLTMFNFPEGQLLTQDLLEYQRRYGIV